MIASDQSRKATWCCVQSGHRERYAIPRALSQAGLLDRLITDVWVPPDSSLARLAPGPVGRRMRDRFHADLPADRVTSFSSRALAWETFARTRGLNDHERVRAHNTWWASLAARTLGRHAGNGTRFVFSYSYGSRALFTTARDMGLVPVLGQIDPGPAEDLKVAEITKRHRDYQTSFVPCDEGYYADWLEECRLAQHILVNSDWSREALQQVGVEKKKIVVCPLVYTPPEESLGWGKRYPAAFSRQRPLRVLFLGQCILRKGIAETIEAARMLADKPVEFTFVGNTDITALESHFGNARIRYLPRVSRVECHDFYREADVFLFPTHSDGFGLTQLEAQAWRLPIIATRFCAEVVDPERTGWILPEVTGASIKEALERILDAPLVLARASANIRPWPFDLARLAERLSSLSVERQSQA